MRARDLLIRCVGAALVLVLANVAMWTASQHTLARQMLRHLSQVPPPTHLFLGDSIMASSLDEAAFAAAMPGSHPLNIALNATTPVEHYLLSRQRSLPHGAWVIYGFVDLRLTDPPDASFRDLVGHRSLAYYVEPAIAFEMYSLDSWWQSAPFRVAAHIPLFVNRNTVWWEVERLRRAAEQLGQPPQATSRFGRAVDFALLEPDATAFALRCAEAVRAQVPFCRPVAALFRRAAANGNPLLVVEMPMTSLHRRRCCTSAAWAAYREHVRALIGDAGGIDLDASDWMPDEAFSDGLHLKDGWAPAFSTRLAAVIAEHSLNAGR